FISFESMLALLAPPVMFASWLGSIVFMMRDGYCSGDASAIDAVRDEIWRPRDTRSTVLRDGFVAISTRFPRSGHDPRRHGRSIRRQNAIAVPRPPPSFAAPSRPPYDTWPRSVTLPSTLNATSYAT